MSLKLIAAVAAVAAVGIALPALTSAQSSGGRNITVREKVQSIRFVHQKRTKTDDRLATGDRVLTASGCLATPTGGSGRCSPTAGVIRFGAPGRSAPLSGSGSYRGMRGELTSGKPGKGYDVDVLHLDA